MNEVSARLVDMLEYLQSLSTQRSNFAGANAITDRDVATLRAINQEITLILQNHGGCDSETMTVTQMPVFSVTDLVETLHITGINDRALREVMLTSDVPLHWSTIYQRVYPLILPHLRQQDKLPQSGHAGMSRWQYRLSWCMQELRTEGLVRSVGNGYWVRSDPDAPQHQAALFED